MIEGLTLQSSQKQSAQFPPPLLPRRFEAFLLRCVDRLQAQTFGLGERMRRSSFPHAPLLATTVFPALDPFPVIVDRDVVAVGLNILVRCRPVCRTHILTSLGKGLKRRRSASTRSRRGRAAL